MSDPVTCGRPTDGPGTGLPDLHGKERPRRKGAASSRVDFVDVWTKLMVQRAEGPVAPGPHVSLRCMDARVQDEHQPWARRSLLRLGRPSSSWQAGEHRYTTAAVASAAKEIYDALRGTYTSPAGHTLPVNGHIQKVRYMTHLKPPCQEAAHELPVHQPED